MMQEMDALGGFLPESIAAWEAFGETSKAHVGRCPQCSQAVNEFVTFIYAHPRPPQPKHWIIEASKDLVIGTLFAIFAPTFYQQAKHWLTDEDKHGKS